MKKRYIFLILFSVLALYLYFSYSYIYERNKTMRLTSSQAQKEYVFGKDFKNKITYVALGDSLTAGVGVTSYEESYPYLFAQQLSQKEKAHITLKPYALPGARVGDAIELLLDGVVQTKPDIVTVLLGVNDVHDRVSPEDFYLQYKIILERLTKETDATIYVVAVPYIGAPNLILPPYDMYFDSQTQKLNEVLLRLVEEYPVKYIDLYATTRESANQKEYYSSDLFHPSLIGYTLWAQILYDAFNQ